jgi:signal transduction histidine kinase
MKFRQKLVAFQVLTVLLIASVTSFMVVMGYMRIVPRMAAGISAKALSCARELASVVDIGIAAKDKKLLMEQLLRCNPRDMPDLDFNYVAVTDPQGDVLASLGKAPNNFRIEPPKGQSSVVKTESGYRSDHAVVLEGRLLGYVSAEFSLEQVEHAQRLMFLFSGLGLLVFLLAGTASVAYAYYLVRPLRTMIDYVHEVSKGDLSKTLSIRAADELGQLALDLNQMTGNLQREMARREQMETKLRLSQKLEAIGQLAAGVAHEINNPLGVILGFAQGMERRVPEGDPLRLPVASILREAIRCKNLVQALLTFSRTAKGPADEVDLNALVRSTAVMLESRAKIQQGRVAQEIAEGLPRIRANKTQIEQVLVNLGNNALDAMSVGGTLTLRTSRDKDGSVLLEVADTGVGIREEILSRIFDPFFTTKEAGQGTGLGLSLVHEIVKQHGGRVDVKSEVGKGTTFYVRFPVSPGLPGAAPSGAESEPGRPGIPVLKS